jgi:hypothetical protein
MPKQDKALNIAMYTEKLIAINLERLNDMLWEFEFVYPETQLIWNDTAMNGALKCFMACMMSRMWDKQQKLNMPIKERKAMAVRLGKDIKKLVLDATDVDTIKLCKGEMEK